MEKIWLVLVLMVLVFETGAKADPNSQALREKLRVKAQECYPDSRYIIVDGALVPKPKEQPPQKVTVYVPAEPVYVAPPPQVYLGFGYTYSNWGGHHGGHCGNNHGGGHHRGH